MKGNPILPTAAQKQLSFKFALQHAILQQGGSGTIFLYSSDILNP
jgi:hypothetical protein